MSEQSKPYKIEGRTPTIYRVVKNKDNPYVMIDRRPVDNPALSFKAKGILTYLLSRPDGWEVSVADLIKHGADGEGAVRSGLKELKLAGHMKYTKSRKQGRITGWLIEVFEVPQSPDRDFPDVENPDVENRGQVLSTLSSTELKDGDKSPDTSKLSIENQIFVGAKELTLPDQTGARRWDIAQLIGMGEKSGAAELAYAFMEARDILIPESKIKGQRKAVREMLEMGVQPEHITEAVRQLLSKNMTVIDLFSVSKTAQDLANKKEVYTGDKKQHAL
jgi:hypothetical protein